MKQILIILTFLTSLTLAETSNLTVKISKEQFLQAQNEPIEVIVNDTTWVTLGPPFVRWERTGPLSAIGTTWLYYWYEVYDELYETYDTDAELKFVNLTYTKE